MSNSHQVAGENNSIHTRNPPSVLGKSPPPSGLEKPLVTPLGHTGEINISEDGSDQGNRETDKTPPETAVEV